MAKANQKFTGNKKPHGKVSSNKLGKGNYRNPNEIDMILGSPQYEEQMRRYTHIKGVN